VTQTPGDPNQRPDYRDQDFVSQGYPAPSAITDLSAERRRGIRRWLPLFIAFDVAVTLGVVGFVGYHEGWFSNESSAHSGGVLDPSGGPGTGYTGDLVPSNSRALSAALISHLPAGTDVMWASGLGEGLKTPGIPVETKNAVFASVLVTWHGNQYWFTIVTDTNASGQALPSVSYPKKDKQGRLVSEFTIQADAGSMIVAMEWAGPGGAGDLPLDDAGFQKMVADPLLGPKTSPEMIARGKSLTEFTDHPPAVKWPHSPI
jgi:hypothetical protein